MTDDRTAAPDRCARCGAAFHCGVDDPQPCTCAALALDAALLASLRAQFATCLCVTCLEQLQALEAARRRSADSEHSLER